MEPAPLAHGLIGGWVPKAFRSVQREAQATLWAPAWAERVAALLPRGRLVVVPGATHVVHYTRPEVVADLVQGLVEERLAEPERARFQPL